MRTRRFVTAVGLLVILAGAPTTFAAIARDTSPLDGATIERVLERIGKKLPRVIARFFGVSAQGDEMMPPVPAPKP